MNYLIVIFPLAAGLSAQVIKFFIKSNKSKIKFKSLLAYSGMPSGHSAMVVSLATIVGLAEGWMTSSFSLSLVLAIIVIRDALGIRRYLGEHGHVLNVLVKDLKDDSVLEHRYPHLLEQIGHTPAQVLAGSILGLFISIIGFLLLK